MCKCIRFPIALRVVMGLLLFGVFGCESVALAEKQVVAVGLIDFRANETYEDIPYKPESFGVRKDSRAFRNMVTTALEQTKKFRVVEREEKKVHELFSEQEAAMLGIAREGYNGDSLQTQGVDYLLTGAVTEFGYIDGGKVAFNLQQEMAVVMAVDLRLMKVRTGEVGFAETVRVQAGGQVRMHRDGQALKDRRSKGVLVGEAMRETATRIANLVALRVYPVKIVRVNANGILTLNYGSGVFAYGDMLDVFKVGNEMIDPDTGENLGGNEEHVGQIVVVDVRRNLSSAKVFESSEDFATGMIVRKNKRRSRERGGLLPLAKPYRDELF